MKSLVDKLNALPNQPFGGVKWDRSCNPEDEHHPYHGRWNKPGKNGAPHGFLCIPPSWEGEPHGERVDADVEWISTRSATALAGYMQAIESLLDAELKLCVPF